VCKGIEERRRHQHDSCGLGIDALRNPPKLLLCLDVARDVNPLWHPHARFHAAILLFLFAGVAATALWLIWRPSLEPKIAITAVALLSASYWTPFFFVPYLLPGSSWWAGIPGHEPRIGGAIVYPNLIVVGLFLAATLVAWRIGTTAQPEP
jgi:hypothetical protein